MATTNIRWVCIKHLIDLVREHPAMVKVLVEPGWPGDKNVRAEMVWVDEVDGDVSIPVMTGGRTHRDDKFDIPFLCRVAGRRDLDGTLTRLTEMMAAIEDVLADSPTLEDFDGVVSAEITSETFTCGETPADGRLGFGRLVVSVHSRLI